MTKSRVGYVLLWVLAGGLVASGAVATKIELDKRKLATAYAQVQTALAQVEQERAHLNQELSQARETLEGQTGDLSHLQARFAQAEQELVQLQREHASLRHTNATLTQQLASVSQEKHALEAKLSSLRELKAAIRSVRRQLWHQHLQGWFARIEAQRAADEQALAQGNRGFVVRGGASTLGTTTKLQVRVLDPTTYLRPEGPRSFPGTSQSEKQGGAGLPKAVQDRWWGEPQSQ